jgi:carboxymethylenebutenolidase
MASYTKEIVDVQGSAMECLVFQPEGAGPHPGLVVAQHLPIAHAGLEKDPFTIDTGERLAKAGYAAIIPFAFHWWPPEAEVEVKRNEWRDDWCIADLDAAYDLLCGLDSVDKSRIGIIGHCWGGRVAWLGAGRNPNYKVSAVLYGGRIKLAMGEDSVPPIDLAGHMKCAMIGIFGNDATRTVIAKNNQRMRGRKYSPSLTPNSANASDARRAGGRPGSGSGHHAVVSGHHAVV